MVYRETPRDVLVVALNEHVLGVDPTTGEPIWRYTLVKALAYNVVRLAVEGGAVFAASLEQVACLDLATGAARWHIRLDQTDYAPTLLLSGDRIFIARGDHLACLTTTGEVLWSRALEDTGGGPAAMAMAGRVAHADG